MIYTITMFEKISMYDDTIKGEPLRLSYPDFGTIHCIGYYSDLPLAIAMLNESGRVKEDAMRYCVVEEIEEGIYRNSKQRLLFEWDKEEKQYKLINEPSTIKNVCNFSMG